jgi:hypothetical protein
MAQLLQRQRQEQHMFGAAGGVAVRKW